MHEERKITEDLYWIGSSDRRLTKFENCFPIPSGVSYNSYLFLDQKTVLLDTVDQSVSRVFFENLEYLLDGHKLDYVIVNHMEPDHAATLGELVLRYPEVTIVGNAKTFQLIRQYFELNLQGHLLEVKEGDTLCSGHHTFSFVMAAMVHWPEVMVTYEAMDKILFSADAFGTFGALSGNIFADEINFEAEWLDEARRYYANIVGKYGVQVQTLLNKAAGLDIEMLCPLHGPVFRVRKKIEWYIDKYSRWATYRPEDIEAVIFYSSVYGNTENAAGLLAGMMADLKVKHIKMYDVSVTDVSYLVSEAFRASHLIFASTTYNGGIFPAMETLLLDLKAHNLQNRTVAVIENGSWAPTAGKKITEMLTGMKNITVLPESITVKSSLQESQREAMQKLAEAVAKSLDEG
jgi:flavorubredoxin